MSFHSIITSAAVVLDGYKGSAIITCRVADYHDLLVLGLPVVQILRLSNEEIEDFAGQLDTRQGEFLNALAEKPERQALATNPYALNMLIDIFKDPKYALPDNREGLYETYVQKRYDDNRREVQGPSRVRGRLTAYKRAWGKLAYRMMLDARGTRVDEQWAQHIAGKQGLRAGINLGLINPVEAEKEMVSFYHDSLYEHFALSRLDLRNGSIRQRIRFIEQLGRLGVTALPALPSLTELFTEENDKAVPEILDAARHSAAEIIEDLGSQSPTTLPLIPELTELFIEESDKENTQVYNAARHALVEIGADVTSEPALRFILLLCLETVLMIIDHDLPCGHDFAHNLAVARDLAFDLALDLQLDLNHALTLAYGLDLAIARDHAFSLALGLHHALNLHLRDEIHKELRALAAKLAGREA